MLYSRVKHVLAASLFLSSVAGAQVVRGTLTDLTNRPVAGAVVMLLDTASQPVARTLSNQQGVFSFQSVATGSYRVRILRIGFEPFTSDPLVATAQGWSAPLQLTSTPISLDTMRITGRNACHDTDTPGAQIYSVWEQARTALTAAQLTSDEHDIFATTIRSERYLDREGQRVLRSASLAVTRPVEQPWHSVSSQTLHQKGYVDVGDTITYRAPDLDALLSIDFVGDHCFKLSESAGRLGLEFTPTPDRDKLPEIEGTLWLDKASAELRRLEFHYVHLAGLLSERSDAELDFVRMKDGTWGISRWFIQMPYVGAVRVNGNVGFHRLAIKITSGDLALARRGADTLWTHAPLSLEGVVTDSTTGDAVAEAEVSLQGTTKGAYTDATGHFVIVGVLPGEYVANVRTPSLDSLQSGMQRAVLVTDSIRSVSFKTLNARQTAAALCPKLQVQGAVQTGMVLGRVNVATDSAAPAGLKVLAQWSDDTVNTNPGSGLAVTRRRHWLETTTDETGSYRICGLPLSDDVDLRATLDSVVGPTQSISFKNKAPYARLDLSLTGTSEGVAMFSGRVLTDTVGVPILNAEIVVDDGQPSAFTNERGAFHLTGVPTGPHHVLVRHIGYGAYDTTLTFQANRSVERAIILPRVTVLDSVVTTLQAAIPSFESHKKLGLGQFKSRADLEKMEQSSLTTVLRDFMGMNIVHSPSARMQGDFATITRGANVCLARVYMDHTAVYSGRPGEPPFDLGAIQVSEIEAIEFYRWPEDVPFEYDVGRSQCGVLVIWTRRGF